MRLKFVIWGVSCMFVLSALNQAYATASSTIVSPLGSSARNMVNCPKITVLGTVLTSSNQRISSGSTNVNDPTQCTTISGGSMGWAVGVVGTNFRPSCPAAFPYFSGLTETWGGQFAFGGGGNMSVKCCRTPFTSMAATNTWTPNAGNGCP